MSQVNRRELLFIETTARNSGRLNATRLIEANTTSTSKIRANPRKRTRTKHEKRAASSSSGSRRRKSQAASQSSYSIKLSTCIATCTATTNLLISIFAFTFLAGAAVAANGEHQQQQLPTVIVRGFLNYRTTVDGTVLLFTPDAGQQASSTAAAAANSIQPTSTAALPKSSSLVFSSPPSPSSFDREIEPTSVGLARDALQTSHVDSSSFRRADRNSFEPAVAAAQPIAEAPEAPTAAQADEWRPVQATPPLRMTQPEQLEQPNKPSVQANDISSPPSSTESSGPATPTESSSRPRRPSLGFSGQGLRPRVPGTAGATSPSLQTRARAGTTGGINGIRRPGLATTTGPPLSSGAADPSHTNSATPSDSAALAHAASAFQNRLASANTRLKNRFKHRQQHTAPPGDSTTSGAPVADSATSGHKQPANNLIAPESLLDVASSIEQPTSAARSAALAPSGTSGQLGSSGPAVGSEEVLAPAGAGPAAPEDLGAITVPVVASPEVLTNQPEVDLSNPLDRPLTLEQQAGSASVSRAGEQRPSSDEPRVLSGQLQQGLLSSGPLQMDTLFQNDQPGQLLSSSSTNDDATPPAPVRPAHHHPKSRPALSKPAHHNQQQHHHNQRPQQGGNNNEKLNGWLGAHHNKFVPRPASKPDSEPGHLSHALATNLNQLLPPQPVSPQPPLAATVTATANASEPTVPVSSAPLVPAASDPSGSSVNATTSGATANSTELTPMQTITRTYSTILETSKTRLVPLQVKSSTAIYTITEDYVMTKVMTAYQTLPAGAEFLLTELSTRAPYDVFESPGSTSAESQKSDQQVAAAPSAAAGGGGRESAAPIDTQEQPISLDTSSPKSANNWLHDFSNPDDPLGGNDNFRSTQEQTMLALLEQQARQGADQQQPNLSQLLGGSNEPLDQLASQLDPAALLADGTINIPDLNNPLVLAAAIQNPQLAAVILAAQQLKLKQRQQQQQLRPNQLGLQQLQQQLAQQAQQQQQLQPSYSTSFSTTVRPSTYVARDTMYTTRLVSFRDGRTVRTRTVSEPGSVIEQTLTTIVTETIPVTVTIKPTAVAGGGGGGLSVPNTATLSQTGGGGQQSSNQATINNALFATQLANILARRQQATQLQTSFQNPALMNFGAPGGQNLAGAAATPQQLLALQQLFARQKQQSQVQQQQQQQQQFQPNFNQLLASINQNNQQQVGAGTNSSSNTSQQQDQSQAASSRANSQNNQQVVQATPALQQPPKSVTSSAQGGQLPMAQLNNNNNNLNLGNQPLTTTLTSLQVRTYTVHNAFKTIFRTITSTVLIPTVISPGATLLPMLG